MQFVNMISGRVQIDPFAGPKATGAVANGKSPGATGDILSAFHQHMNHELGKLADSLPGKAHASSGDETAKSLPAGKPAKKQTAASLPAGTSAADEATSSPPPRPSDPAPNSPGMTNGSPASAAPPDPRLAAISELPVVTARVVTENAGRVESAAQETLPAAAGKTDWSRLPMAAVASAGQAAVENISRSQAEPPKAFPGPQPAPSKASPEGQPGALAETVPVDIENASEGKPERTAVAPEGDDQGESGEASAAVAQTASALPPAQLSTATEVALPPGAAQNPQDQTVKLVGGDAFAQLVNAVPMTKPATTNENSARQQTAAEHDNHDNTVDPRRLKAAAAPERKTAESGATRVADATEVSPAREPGASARAAARVSDDGLASSPFTQALVAERSKAPAAEADVQTAAPSTNAGAASHAMAAADEASALHLQSARLTASDSQAEMQVGLQTADYGHVEIKASLQNSTVGATIAVEHAALRDQIVSALPELRHSFTERQITLESLTVSDSLSATTSFANSHQQRSNQQQAAVPDQGSQQRRAEPDWEAKPGASSGPELQSWAGDSGSELNVLV